MQSVLTQKPKNRWATADTRNTPNAMPKERFSAARFYNGPWSGTPPEPKSLSVEAASLADLKNFSAVGVGPALGHTAPMVIGAGGGESGINFSRGPAEQEKLRGTI